MPYDNILFAGVGRIRDQLLIASVFDRITSDDKRQIKTALENVLVEAMSRFSPGCRDKTTFPIGTLYMLADREMCCVYAMATRTKLYPERVAFAFLAEFADTVRKSDAGKKLNVVSTAGALTKGLKGPMKALMDKYDNPAQVDVTAEVHGKVERVKGMMQENINKVIETQADLTHLEATAETLSINAEQFERSVQDVRKHFHRQNTTLFILLTIVCLGVGAYLVFLVVNLVR